MPLFKRKSQKAFEHNLKAELHAGKPKDQALAISYAVKRKAKKASGGAVQSGSKDMNMAEGGEVSAKNERRPMPDNRYNDSKEASRNSGNKPSKNDNWLDNLGVAAAKKPSLVKLSQPRMVESGVLRVKMRDDEHDLMDRIPPSSDKDQPSKDYDESGPDRQGHPVRDMEDEHSTHRKPYAKGGMIDDMKHPSKHDIEPADDEIEAKERREQMNHLSEDAPSEDEGAAHAREDDEEGQDRQGDEVPDMEDQHNSGRKPYYMGGPAVKKDHPHLMFEDNESNEDHDMELNPAHGRYSPDDSENDGEFSDRDNDYYDDDGKSDSIAAAIMARRDREHAKVDSGAYDLDEAVKMAEGGYLNGEDSMDSDDSSQVDLSRNAEEDMNLEDQASFDAMRKENYSESESLEELGDQPRDSNLKGDDEEDESENKHDMISQIRSKMNQKRQFKAR